MTSGIDLGKSFGSERLQSRTLTQKPLYSAPPQLDRRLPRALGGLAIPFQPVADQHGETAFERRPVAFRQVVHLVNQGRNINF
jgi:hypothetical protein